MFVDPRSTKIRDNFQVLNENLAEIRKLDPNLRILQKVSTQSRMPTYESPYRKSQKSANKSQTKSTDWKHKSNAEILSEILKIGRGANSLY